MQIRREVLKLMVLTIAAIVIIGGCVPHSLLEPTTTATMIIKPSSPTETATAQPTVTETKTETVALTATATEKTATADCLP